MHEFDRPLFKRLAHNDTGAAPGHQGGVLIPKEMDKYFPQLAGSVSATTPAIDKRIRAALFIGSLQVDLVETRYQYQSWKGTRTPERRLTDNLTRIRNAAAPDDFFLIERSLSDPEFYRLTLHKAGTQPFNELVAKAGGRRWGPVETGDIPVPETEIENSEAEQAAREADPFDPFDNSAALQESRVKRIARSQAFSRRVLPLYDYRCAVCGLGHADRDFRETEAAHIVPRGLKGADDARNGLALCRSHHWAFDRGLFGVRPDRRIVLRPDATSEPRNAHLLPFDGTLVQDPSNAALRPALSALAWHLQHVVCI